MAPDAISLPKSSTAVVAQQADTRLMSWSTRITSAPVSSGIRWITPARALGLLVGQAGGRLVQEYEARGAHDGPSHLDETTLGGTEGAHLVVSVHSSPTKAMASSDGLAASAARPAGVLVDEKDVVEHGEVGDRLLGLERPSHAPPGPPEVVHRQQVVAEGADPTRRTA